MHIRRKIIDEWFFRLPKGYATPPYSHTELDVLQEVLLDFHEKYGNKFSTVSNINETISKLRGSTLLESKMDFMKSPEGFTQFVLNKYSNPGTQIRGLKRLHAELMRFPETLRKKVGKLILDGQGRQLSHGTFKMGQYERALLQALRSSQEALSIPPLYIWVAILFNGVVNINQKEEATNITPDIFVGNHKVMMKNLDGEPLKFLQLSTELNSSLQSIIEISSLLKGEEIIANTREEINDVLSKLRKEDVEVELERILAMSQDSDVKALSGIAGKISAALENATPLQVADQFCSLIDASLTKVLNDVNFWMLLQGDKVYIDDANNLFGLLSCKRGYLSDGIVAIRDSVLYINGSLVEDFILQ